MSEDRLSTRVGAAVLAALALAVVVVLLLEGRRLRPGIRVHVEMERVGALQEGAAVRLAGLELGEVDAIRLVGRPSRAVLDLWIDRRHAWLVTTTTDFFLSQEGLLGEPYLGVAGRAGEPGPPLEDGATVRGIDPPHLDHLLTTVDSNLRAATQLMRDGLPEGDALGAALDDLERTLAGIEAPETSGMTRLFAEVRTFTGAVPPGTLDRASALASGLRAPRLGERMARLGAHVDRLAAGMDDPRLARFGAALAGAGALVARAERALAIAAELRALVASGRGSLGAFLQDVELADEMKDLTKELKRQPWKTLGRPQR